MSIGLGRAGFDHVCMAECNSQACLTLNSNFRTPEGLRRLSILERDVRNVDWTGYRGAELVAGGPPCQPFSNGGLSAGANDARDMWPEAIRAVTEIRPKAFLFENVKGLLRPKFKDYLDRILKSLERGSIAEAERAKLYDVVVVPVNAADYGAAQARERVFVAGIRKDVGTLAPFPRATHTAQRLVWDKWISGEYWKRHSLARPDATTMSRAERSVLSKLYQASVEPEGLPWRTCRDAFAHLGEPRVSPSVQGHEPRGAGKQYPGHTGSVLDWPAKALKAGTHGVPGGENMLVDAEGSARYFTIREAARLQGLPDSFVPFGSSTQVMRQLGNAVPAQLAEVAACWIAKMLLNPCTLTDDNMVYTTDVKAPPTSESEV